MNKQLSKRNSGFTMIELMIVLVVVAVLVALAYPSYASYVRKAKRGEAMQLLLNWSINQEIWRSNNTAYADTDDIPAPTHDNYDFSITAGPSASAYTLQAEAKGGDDQENDATKAGDSCATLSIDQNGTKGPEAACWD
jgi:type IV pilus assembly protein PilE